MPTAGGTPKQVSTGAGIETSPMPLAAGTHFAALTADAKRPQSVGVFSLRLGEQKVIYPTLPGVIPESASRRSRGRDPQGRRRLRVLQPALRAGRLKPGEKRPAMIFVHGGPVRQMLLGYHYRHFYHMAYAVNQWLASQGYIVMSVNFRSGVGYGRSFRQAPNTGGSGNSEYQDVLAAGKYLHARPDVDTKRVGIWGLSYGGVLTAQALARNSDLFAAGIDLAGVHLWGSSLDPDVGVVSILGDRRDRQMEVAGPARPRRRRPQRRVPADDRPRPALTRARRPVRAHRLPGRRARLAAALALGVHVQAHGRISEEVPDGQLTVDTVGSGSEGTGRPDPA